MDTNKLTTKSRDAVSAALRNALTAATPTPSRHTCCTRC